MMDFRVDYVTSLGNGGYIVVSAKTKVNARRKAREQIILLNGEKITELQVGNGQYFS